MSDRMGDMFREEMLHTRLALEAEQREREASTKLRPHSFYYPLFEHISKEHGLTLTDSELGEIVRIAKRLNGKEIQP